MVTKIKNNDMSAAKAAPLAVVDFSATWCGPCKMLAPVMDALADEMDGKVAFFNADVDENRDLALQNNISSIPALIFLKDGKVTGTSVGFMPGPQLKSWVESHC